jgi:acyl carrier protein
MIFRFLRMIFRSAEQKVAFFCKDRSPQSDEQFLTECGLPADPEADRVALAVRRAVANLGSIDPQFIRADDVYPDQLGMLPFWDSIDVMAYIWELEEQLGTRFTQEELRGPPFTQKEWELVGGPSAEETLPLFRSAPVSVRQMVAVTYLMLLRRGASG